MNIGEVVQNLSFVNGGASAITNTIQGTDSRSTSIDLRGLGASSTLTLMDGKRLVNENVNALIPTIAIQRIDIVADGAAALYGNEAVAGVVNFVPYRTYDGLRIESYAEGDSRGDYDEHSVQMLWGGDIGGLDVVVAGQFRQNSRLGWDERPIISQSGLTWSSSAPGNWRVPHRGEDGQYTGEFTNTIDPNCAAEREGFMVDQVSSAFGFQDPAGRSCKFDYGDNRSYREPTETNQFFANATWDYSDNLTLSAQGFWTRLAERTYESTTNPGGDIRLRSLPTVRGELPGNPFRAVNAAGQPLYAVDWNADGLPDRDPNTDLNGDGLPDAILTGNGGLEPWIPLFEDVRATGLRPINKTNTLPRGHSPDYDNMRDLLDHIGRWNIQADFTVPFIEGWEGMAAYTQNYRDYAIQRQQRNSFGAIVQGLSCDVVSDRDACYNPFFVTDPANLTSRNVLEAIVARETSYIENKLSTIDIVLNGQIPNFGFELPGGPIAAAVGYQYRDFEYTDTPAPVDLAGDAWRSDGARSMVATGNREIDAWFIELAVPVLDNLELELAVRNETFNTGQESTDPKYGITYAPTDWLTLRATQGDAFIAPTLPQLLTPQACTGLETITDRFGPFDAFTTECSGGNPNLKNEFSRSRQFGFDLVFDDFDFHVTWNETDFQNRIVGISGQTIMDLDFINFQQWSGFTGSGLSEADRPSESQLRSWLASGLADPRITREPFDIYKISTVTTGSTNAQTVQVTAYDIQGNYSLGFDGIGDFRIGLQATYIDEFLYQQNPTRPFVKADGKQNRGTGSAPALPKLKANLRLGWVNGNHSLVSTVHYMDSMVYDGSLRTWLNAYAHYYHPDNIRDIGILAWTDMDIAYTYRGLELFDGEMSMTIGSRNVFDREAQRTPDFAGVIGELQDPLGRVVYARLVYDF
ncbi:MAG: TonB-dependent receptor [Gammaproteobacteria bacterium]|nr:TonB-dependent receptor [Gammaproteobacteria bacterium]MYG95821.1 TonB-dependent receptor [Gammaproteobacteria bacterium]